MLGLLLERLPSGFFRRKTAYTVALEEAAGSARVSTPLLTASASRTTDSLIRITGVTSCETSRIRTNELPQRALRIVLGPFSVGNN
jgi:hypothetical protein